MHEWLQGVDLKAFREFLENVGGNTFWSPRTFLEMGFAKPIVDRSTRDHASSSDDPTRQIIDQKRLMAAISSGEISSKEALEILIEAKDPRFKLEHLVAVHEIDFMQSLARALGTPVSQKIGRGSRATELAHGLLAYLDTTSRSV